MLLASSCRHQPMNDLSRLMANIMTGIVVLACLTILWKIVAFIRRKRKIAGKKRELKRVIEEVSRNGTINQLADSPILLQSNEAAVWAERTTLFEPRAVRRRINGVSRSFQQWEAISRGMLVLTTKRFVFDGEEVNRTIPFNKLLSSCSTPSGDEIHVASASRQKEMAFSSRNSFLLSWLLETLARQ